MQKKEFSKDNNTDKEYLQRLLQVMKYLDSFCTDHNIKYFACGGTAIGAVRHKGFIPWDDDIDVFMARPDYEKFLLLRKDLEDTDYEIQDMREAYYPVPYAKFVHKYSSVWECERNPYVYGVYIDILPLDEVGNDRQRTSELFRKNKKYSNLFSRSLQNNFCKSELSRLKRLNITSWVRWIINVFFVKPLASYWRKQVYSITEQIKAERGDCYMFYGTPYKMEKEIFPKEWFSSQVQVSFENIEIKLPNGWHEYLSKLYGDYMTPPPADKRATHHNRFFVDLHNRLSVSEIYISMNLRSE